MNQHLFRPLNIFVFLSLSFVSLLIFKCVVVVVVVIATVNARAHTHTRRKNVGNRKKGEEIIKMNEINQKRFFQFFNFIYDHIYSSLNKKNTTK